MLKTMKIYNTIYNINGHEIIKIIDQRCKDEIK